MRVVEATGASGANPKLLDSMYTVEQIILKGGRCPCNDPGRQAATECQEVELR
jgi:hypothetical protein